MPGGDDRHQRALPPLVVEIGLKDVYDLLIALNTTVVEMRGDTKDLVKQAEDHEARLRALERGRWPLPSVAVLVSILALGITVVPLLITP